jgi:3-oxoacyl-[acyl-carrier protein] reductase
MHCYFVSEFLPKREIVSRQRVALVTGASRGIGRAIADRLVADGFNITISARNSESLHRAADELRDAGGEVFVAPADMAVEGDVIELAIAHDERFGELDLLVICAGVGFSGELGDFPIRKSDVQFVVNFRSPLMLIQQLLPTLRATAALESEIGSKVIALSSITGVAAEPDLAAYGASKAALISLCESIIVAEAKNGVTATSVSPGFVDTDMTEWVRDRVDPSTMIRADDIAIIVSALSKLSRFAAVPNVVLTRPGEQLWRA